MREQVTYRLYAGAWALVRRLPERPAYALFDLLADLVWRRRGAAVPRLEANLRRARPAADEAELRSLSRAGMRSYLRYWCDAFRLPDWSRDRVVSSVRVVGEDYLRTSTGPGERGVVGALMHMGNWDHAGAWASLTGVPVVTVAERLRPERLYERFLAYREGLGMEILPLTGGERDVLDVLSTRLRAGRLVPPAGRPRPARQRHRGRPARRADPAAARSGDAGAAHRGGAAPGEHLARGGRHGPAAAGHPLPRRGAPAVQRHHAGEGRPR